MSNITYDQRRTMVCNAVMFTYTFLASFPIVGEGERAAVQLVLDHIFTFNTKLGRIVLTRKGYEQAQELFPQLLILASRHEFVFTIGKKPSVMEIARIIQVIIEPLVGNLGTLGWAEIYLSEDDARQLLKLALPRLQARVDEWVCEQSDLDISQPASSRDCPDSRITHPTIPSHPSAPLTMDQDHTHMSLVSNFCPPVPLDPLFAGVYNRPAPQSHGNSTIDQHFAPTSASGALPMASTTPNTPTREQTQRARDVVWWWSASHQPSPPPANMAKSLDAQPEAIPAPLESTSIPSTTCDLGEVSHSPFALVKTSKTDMSSRDIYLFPSKPVKDSKVCSETLDISDRADVWWKPLVNSRAQHISTSPRLGTQLGSSLTNSGLFKTDSHSTSQDHSSSLPLGQLLPGLVEANVHKPDGLRHPRPVRAPALSRLIIPDIVTDHRVDTAASDAPSPMVYPPEHQMDQGSLEPEVLHTQPTPSLYPSIVYRPWIDSSSTRSTLRDFSPSELSLELPSPAGSWGRQFSGSPSSFGPTTPTDLVSPRWHDDHYLADMRWAPEFDDASPAHDLRSRANIEVRKAKEATTCRKLRRKLKAVLSNVWNAYA